MLRNEIEPSSVMVRERVSIHDAIRKNKANMIAAADTPRTPCTTRAVPYTTSSPDRHGASAKESSMIAVSAGQNLAVSLIRKPEISVVYNLPSSFSVIGLFMERPYRG